MLGRQTGTSLQVCCIFIGFTDSLDFWIFSLQSIIFDEVDLTDASVAESSTKNVNNSFTVGFFFHYFLFFFGLSPTSLLFCRGKTCEQSSQPLSLKKKKKEKTHKLLFPRSSHKSSLCTWEIPWITMYIAKTLHLGIFFLISWEGLVECIYTGGQKNLFCWGC